MDSVIPSVSEWVRWLVSAGFVRAATMATLAGIVLPLLFILARRAWRRRYFQRRDQRTTELRRNWEQLLNGTYPAEKWRLDELSREIVESILIDQLEVAGEPEAARLRHCLRSSGLLDIRIWQTRHLRGWRRRAALVSLGRMRAPEAVAALAEALEDSSSETRLAALHGLGNTGLPRAGEKILATLSQRALRVPERPLQNALLNCCAGDPWLLIPHLHRADDRLRPVLARVLGELATADLQEELIALSSDPLPEVRASAARALGQAKPRLALTALSQLAADEAWFVRLRAVVALGEIRDPRSIPVLVGTLCDANRHVRIRSATALARLEGNLESIVDQVIRTRDRYALQALVSELERSGRILALVNALGNPVQRAAAEEALLATLRAGAQRLLLDALVHHADWRTRLAAARVLARSREPRLIAPLERLAAAITPGRQQRVVRWVLEKLRAEATPAAQPDPVNA